MAVVHILIPAKASKRNRSRKPSTPYRQAHQNNLRQI